MDLTFSTEQNIFRKSIRDFITNNYSTDFLRDNVKKQQPFPAKLWTETAELGWLGIALPERYGGSELGIIENVILFEEIGRVCFVSPLLSSILSGLLIDWVGSEIQKERYLPEIISGAAPISIALWENEIQSDDSPNVLLAEKGKNGIILRGFKSFVPDAEFAEYLLCLGKTSEGENSVFIVNLADLEQDYEPLKTVLSDWLYNIEFRNVKISSDYVLGEFGNGEEYIENIKVIASLLKSAEMLGGADSVLKMLIDYSKIRQQFGRNLASFQAYQHKCAEMLMHIDLAKDLIYHAAWLVDRKLPYKKEACMAKAWMNVAYKTVLHTGHQLFGAIGFCEEHDIGLYLRHSKSCEVGFGDTRALNANIANLVYIENQKGEYCND